MLKVNYEERIGTLVIEQKKGKFEIGIFRANCLCAFVHRGENVDTVYNFYLDADHIKRIKKNNGCILWDKVESIELNMFYKESKTLLNAFVKEGYRVTCYYEKVKD